MKINHKWIPEQHTDAPDYYKYVRFSLSLQKYKGKFEITVRSVWKMYALILPNWRCATNFFVHFLYFFAASPTYEWKRVVTDVWMWVVEAITFQQTEVAQSETEWRFSHSEDAYHANVKRMDGLGLFNNATSTAAVYNLRRKQRIRWYSQEWGIKVRDVSRHNPGPNLCR